MNNSHQKHQEESAAATKRRALTQKAPQTATFAVATMLQSASPAPAHTIAEQLRDLTRENANDNANDFEADPPWHEFPDDIDDITLADLSKLTDEFPKACQNE